MRRLSAGASGAASARMRRVVDLAHHHLGMDTLCLSEFAGARQVFRVVAGDGPSFDLAVGDGQRLMDGYCQRMVTGQIPDVIPDTSAEPRVAALPITAQRGIGAYVGVPLALAGGALYGSLFGLSHAPVPTLDGQASRFLRVLADLLMDDLTDHRDYRHHRAGLSRLIATQGLQVAYQPVVDLRDGSVLGVEALARFPDEEHPEDTFAAAHDVGLGHDLERLAARKALDVLPRLAAEQFLSVNLSPEVALSVAWDDDDLVPAPLLPRLVVEITEHVAVDSYAALRRRLADPRGRGLRIAIDDAGAGYASLRHVVELQPDFIKVDRTLVHGVASDHARRIAVSSFVLLALDLGATVVAEGVEVPADLATLVDLGVDAAQGYLLDRPSSSAQRLGYWAKPSRRKPPDLHPAALSGPVRR